MCYPYDLHRLQLFPVIVGVTVRNAAKGREVATAYAVCGAGSYLFQCTSSKHGVLGSLLPPPSRTTLGSLLCRPLCRILRSPEPLVYPEGCSLHVSTCGDLVILSSS